eukprot:7752763-Pyramimonas_sp.AAC.1
MDRAFVSLTPPFILETEVTLSVQQEATRLSDWGKKPPRERSIPDYVFRVPEYKVELNEYLAHADWTGCSVEERWTVAKD